MSVPLRGEEMGGKGDLLSQLVVGEGVGVGALSVEFFLGERGAGVGLVGLAVFFALLALGRRRHCGEIEDMLAEEYSVG